MKKVEVVKNKEEFNSIIKMNNKYKNTHYYLFFKPLNNNKKRFGIAISTQCGNAVLRNLEKRRLRFLIDKHKKKFKKSGDYIIIIRKGNILDKFINKEQQFIDIIEKVNK